MALKGQGEVFGLKELDALFEELSKGVANRIARPALMKSGRVLVKHIKARVPSKAKHIRKLIGIRSVKTKNNSGVASVKVGAAVGRKKDKNKKTKARNDRKGVGISEANVHWWFVGTADRTTGFTTRRRRLKTGGSIVVSRKLNGNIVRETGRMKPQVESVTSIAKSHRSELVEIMRKSISVNIEMEAQRQARKRMA